MKLCAVCNDRYFFKFEFETKLLNPKNAMNHYAGCDDRNSFKLELQTKLLNP